MSEHEQTPVKKQIKVKQSKKVVAEAPKVVPEIVARIAKGGEDYKQDAMFVVKKSKIPDAGKGLFARVALKKGRLMEYTGQILYDMAEAAGSRYAIQISKKYFVDARDPKKSNKARFINAPPSGTNPNVKFTINTKSKKAFVDALRPIEAGEELYVDYGPDYWDLHKKE